MIEKEYILTGDIGATNPSFALVEIPNYKIVDLERRTKPDEKEFYKFLNSFIERINKKFKIKIRNACFSIAGPVENRKTSQFVTLTNVDYCLDSNKIMKLAGLKKCLFINDFQAISSAVNILDKKDVFILNKGNEEKFANKAVIGAGTDLGKSILGYDKDKKSYISLASEGSHAEFPISNRREFEMVQYIKRKKKLIEVDYGTLVSGKGIESIYNYLQTTEYPRQPRNLDAKEISESRSSNPCSKKTFQFFIRFYARSAKNFAFETLSKGGMYIAGGIAQKNLDAFEGFMEEFTNHDIYSDLLKKIPVKIITDYDISHKGAAFAFMNQ